MNYYNYNQKNNMNRAQRRKNGIKTPQMPKTSYSKEDLERVLKKELTDLINEPYTETIKRERYKRLEPLIKEYQSQKDGEKKKNTNNEPKQIYNRQREELKNNPVYQRLNNNSIPKTNKIELEQKQNYTRKRAIEAYQTQMNYSRNNQTKKVEVSQKVNTKQSTKKSLFSKICDIFKPATEIKTIEYKQTIVKPKTMKEAKRYKNPRTIYDVRDEVYNEFEKQLRNFQNYSRENKSYQYIRNGRQVRYEPRYL